MSVDISPGGSKRMKKKYYNDNGGQNLGSARTLHSLDDHVNGPDGVRGNAHSDVAGNGHSATAGDGPYAGGSMYNSPLARDTPIDIVVDASFNKRRKIKASSQQNGNCSRNGDEDEPKEFRDLQLQEDGQLREYVANSDYLPRSSWSFFLVMMCTYVVLVTMHWEHYISRNEMPFDQVCTHTTYDTSTNMSGLKNRSGDGHTSSFRNGHFMQKLLLRCPYVIQQKHYSGAVAGAEKTNSNAYHDRKSTSGVASSAKSADDEPSSGTKGERFSESRKPSTTKENESQTQRTKEHETHAQHDAQSQKKSIRNDSLTNAAMKSERKSDNDATSPQDKDEEASGISELLSVKQTTEAPGIAEKLLSWITPTDKNSEDSKEQGGGKAEEVPPTMGRKSVTRREGSGNSEKSNANRYLKQQVEEYLPSNLKPIPIENDKAELGYMIITGCNRFPVIAEQVASLKAQGIEPYDIYVLLTRCEADVLPAGETCSLLNGINMISFVKGHKDLIDSASHLTAPIVAAAQTPDSHKDLPKTATPSTSENKDSKEDSKDNEESKGKSKDDKDDKDGSKDQSKEDDKSDPRDEKSKGEKKDSDRGKKESGDNTRDSTDDNAGAKKRRLGEPSRQVRPRPAQVVVRPRPKRPPPPSPGQSQPNPGFNPGPNPPPAPTPKPQPASLAARPKSKQPFIPDSIEVKKSDNPCRQVNVIQNSGRELFPAFNRLYWGGQADGFFHQMRDAGPFGEKSRKMWSSIHARLHTYYMWGFGFMFMYYKNAAVLEDDLILSPALHNYNKFGSAIMEKDRSVISASAWSDNARDITRRMTIDKLAPEVDKTPWTWYYDLAYRTMKDRQTTSKLDDVDTQIQSRAGNSAEEVRKFSELNAEPKARRLSNDSKPFDQLEDLASDKVREGKSEGDNAPKYATPPKEAQAQKSQVALAPANAPSTEPNVPCPECTPPDDASELLVLRCNHFGGLGWMTSGRVFRDFIVPFMSVGKLLLGWDSILSFQLDKLLVNPRTGEPAIDPQRLPVIEKAIQEDDTRNLVAEKSIVLPNGSIQPPSETQEQLLKGIGRHQNSKLYEKSMKDPATLGDGGRPIYYFAEDLPYVYHGWITVGPELKNEKEKEQVEKKESIEAMMSTMLVKNRYDFYADTTAIRVSSVYPTVGLTHHRTTQTGISVKSTQNQKALDRISFWKWKFTNFPEVDRLCAWGYEGYLERILGIGPKPGLHPPKTLKEDAGERSLLPVALRKTGTFATFGTIAEVGSSSNARSSNNDDHAVVPKTAAELSESLYFFSSYYGKQLELKYTAQNVNLRCLYNAFGDADEAPWQYMKSAYGMIGVGWGNTPRGAYKGTILVYHGKQYYWVIARYSPYYNLLCSACDVFYTRNFMDTLRELEKKRWNDILRLVIDEYGEYYDTSSGAQVSISEALTNKRRLLSNGEDAAQRFLSEPKNSSAGVDTKAPAVVDTKPPTVLDASVVFAVNPSADVDIKPSTAADIKTTVATKTSAKVGANGATSAEVAPAEVRPRSALTALVARSGDEPKRQNHGPAKIVKQPTKVGYPVSNREAAVARKLESKADLNHCVKGPPPRKVRKKVAVRKRVVTNKR